MGKQDELEATESTYRKYAAQVERTVAGSFEHVNEWADFITFLARLLKTLQLFPNYTDIPHKLLIAKRLAQCLNPALPTGVHQRALDVYVHIFSIIGPDQLRLDLPVWSSGLFPFFQYAATSVRPIVLGIYSEFFLPLQETLRPCTKAIILALLPGLEEDTGDSFDRVMGLLDQISGTVSPSFFLQNLWLVLLTAPSSRTPALNYLLRRMPQIGPQDSLSVIVGEDIGLMIRAFSAALQDGQLLVQRGALDLLVTVLPLNGTGFRDDARPEDRILLMRSAAGVVLRRDLSLSRRLYTWLLGRSDVSEEQIGYLQQYGLEALAQALREMTRESNEDSVKGLKIFLSLLDKWEIGTPLTQNLALETISTMQAGHNSIEGSEELSLSRKTLFDAFDPFLVWRELHSGVQSELSADNGDEWVNIKLAQFVLEVFRPQEEEVLRLHLPLLVFAMIESLPKISADETASPTATRSTGNRFAETLTFLVLAIGRLPADLLMKPAQGGEMIIPSQLAARIYAATDIKQADLPTQPFDERNACAALDTVFTLAPSTSGLLLLTALLQRIRVGLRISWDPARWMANATRVASSRDFAYLAAFIRTIVAIERAQINPGFHLDRRDIVVVLIDRLLFYLESDHAPHLVEATELLWVVQGLTKHRHVESIICSRLSSSEASVRTATHDAFGNLWRFTDDAELPGTILAAPMYMLLDTLRSEDLETRRAGEAWMRCSLKSYLRIVDPILCLFLPFLAATEPISIELPGDVRLLLARCPRKFDAARLHHALENLLSLARFGGQGFTRITRSVAASSSPDPQLKTLLLSAGFSGDSYLDCICKALIAILATEPSPPLVSTLGAVTGQMHATAVELLQVIVSRGDLELPILQACQTTLLSCLLLHIERGRLELQNKLLHVLHAVIQATSTTTQRKSRSKSIGSDSNEAQTSAPRESTEQPIDPLLSRTLCDGIMRQSDSAVIHHWVDFLLMTAPHFRRSPDQLMLPLIRTLTARIVDIVQEFEETYDTTRKGKKVSTVSTDADFTVVVNALERLVVMLEEARASTTVEESSVQDRGPTADLTQSTTGGFLGYVTGVLGAGDAASPVPDAPPRIKRPALACFEGAVLALLKAWEISCRLQRDETEVTSSSYILSRVKSRSRKALERLYKAQPGDTLESIVLYWARLLQGRSAAEQQQHRVFSLVDHLISSPQAVTAQVIERAQARAPVAHSDRIRQFQLNVDLSDETLYAFLEAFFGRLEPSSAVQVWSTFLSVTKDMLLNTNAYRIQLFPVLRCLTALGRRIAQTSALEDRRMRRDLQDNYIRLAEATLAVSAKDNEGRPRTTSANASGNPPMMPKDANGIEAHNEKDTEMIDSQVLETDRRASSKAAVLSEDLIEFLARQFLTGLREFLVDADKVSAICSVVVQQIIAPVLRGRSRLSQIMPDGIFALLLEMTSTPSALRAWRSIVADCFSDARFFDVPPSSSQRWRPLVNALLTAEKDRFYELINNVSSAKSANIFANRELETTLRQTNLRRLSFAILAGEQNRYLTQMPLIQEKLVDLLRSPVGHIVHAEVFLAFRVLLCRIGEQHFASLWPVILTEMIHLFDAAREPVHADSREFLQLVLGACKFIDLLLVLQSEDFQMWALADTVDAILPPNGYQPQAVLDRLSELVAARTKRVPSPALVAKPMSRLPSGESVPTRRKPLLANTRAQNLKSLSSLDYFFSRISMASYESTYACAPVDRAAVEDSLDRDLFEAD